MTNCRDFKCILFLLIIIPLKEFSWAKKNGPIWLHPCGPSETHENTVKYYRNLNKINVNGKNKASSKPLRRVRTQIMDTWLHFNTELSLRPKLCYVDYEFGQAMNFDWMPQNQLQWYREHAKCLSRKEKVLLLLPKLHEGLQNLTAAFQKLRQVKDNQILSECAEKSRQFISEVGDKLIQLLCEVHMAIKNLGLPNQPKRLTWSMSRAILPDYGSAFTNNALIEWGVLFGYKQFLDEWTKIVKIIVGSKGDRRCKERPNRKRVKPTEHSVTQHDH